MQLCHRLFWFCAISMFALSCDSNNVDGNKLKELKIENSITYPILMIFPSDALLKRLGCLKKVENQGVTSYIRDYKKAFVKSSELKFIIGTVEEKFAKAGYPIENLEQHLKQIDNENALNDMDFISTDNKTMLLNTARPDYILELDYEAHQDPNSRNPKSLVNYLISAIDIYSNKTIANVTEADMSNPDNKSIIGLIKSSLEKNTSSFLKQLNFQFKDINQHGSEITLRINMEGTANFNLNDECLGNENYKDFINSWLKSHTVNQTFKPIYASDNEMKYTNIRINSKTSNGKKYLAYDFALDLKIDLEKGCGIKVKNQTQGIGDAFLTIKGLK